MSGVNGRMSPERVLELGSSAAGGLELAIVGKLLSQALDSRLSRDCNRMILEPVLAEGHLAAAGECS